ncbi:hypothetical protein [Polaribacter sp. Hel1_85]|uniref:hypothetical protein n=1 Tax=Polaribacter sp. Hel1_85 TaxID=1250005 RepID=UPI00052C8005|nr:hypothetical protein [Polaribacter sp. Hel1_85]KGL64199.1 hypothetical protein PHEL85_1251 [Polaribacter sp. Hel1_85]
MTNPFQEIKTATKVFGLLLFTMATSFCSYAQDPIDDEIDGLLDELFFNDQQFLDELIESDFSYNFLYTSVSYNSNTFFSGRDSGTDQFNIIPQVSYYHSSGFNASISGIYYQNFAPSWDFTSVSAGYFNTIGKKKIFNYNLGYTKYFYSDDYDGFTNSLDVSLGIRNKKRTLGTNISGSYLFGTEESYQLVSSSFVNLTLKRTSNFALRLRPRLNFIIAKQSLTISRLVTLANATVYRTFNFDVFDLLNTQINFPLSLSLKSWDFELGYNLNLPNSLVYEDSLKNTSYFNLSVGYLFDLSK